MQIEQLGAFEKVIGTLDNYFKHSSEQIKRESLKVLQQYLIRLSEQVVRQDYDANKQFEVLNLHCGLLKSVSSKCLPMMSDYFDSVREEACIAVEYMINHFMPIKPDLGKKNNEMVQMLKA